MSKDEILDFNKPKLFVPSIDRTITRKPGNVRGITLRGIAQRNFGNTGSFRYDGPKWV